MSSEQNNDSLDYKVKILVIIILIILGSLATCQGPFLVRVFFIIMASIFPAMMYWLFIKNMKHGHLGVFFNNLDKLGLLGHMRIKVNGDCKKELDLSRERRIYTYLHKFQGVYGPFTDDLRDEIDEKIQKTPQHPIQFNSKPTKFFKPQTCIPIFFATVLITIGWVITLPPIENTSIFTVLENISLNLCTYPVNVTLPTEFLTNANNTAYLLNLGPLTPNQTPVNFAFLGAYLFSVVMLVHRYHRRDLRASAYVSVSLRIILAIILIWTVQTLVIVMDIVNTTWSFDPIHLMVAGFIIGAFPQTGWQLIEMFAKNICGLVTPTFKTPLPLKDIEGLTIWNEARLEEEDIMNIPNMATADIVDLMLTTQISPDRIIDWVDQAILYTCIGPEDKKSSSLRQELRSYGIRTASSLIEIYKESESSDETLAQKLPKIDLSKIDTLIVTIKTNPNIKLIQTWKKYPIKSPIKEACQSDEM
ncbi:hypothetical protein J7W08_04750 [Methanococcoides orientis]|uniref:hypothetical protein n=1 Tax=Methanococcoides orientis TaxID=2822137 RepID=UPI001E5C80E7|nr:hypothetical protein [Methanococcoides orientis]UGV41600.1 hypothetical protein J7W08_04750 [Methanococcoides orientis]